jgi:hypothetical protein
MPLGANMNFEQYHFRGIENTIRKLRDYQVLYLYVSTYRSYACMIQSK